LLEIPPSRTPRPDPERQADSDVRLASGRRVRLLLSDIAPEEGVAIQLFLFEPQVDGR
jgi:hypothetical protein